MDSLLQLLYPLAAVVIGALLYLRYPALYVGFAWWVWFLTPEVRRLIDYQQGWNPGNPVMLAPYLVAGLTFFALVRHLPKLQFRRLFPFGLIFLALLYGYSVGIFRTGPASATFDLLNWLVPVVFAFYLVVHWRSYPRYRQVFQRTFVWGVLIMGLYGLLQFFVLPPWDRYWMLHAPLGSLGRPEPLKLVVFSTLNAPGPFAGVLMAGLLVLFTGGGLLRWPSVAAGYLSFLLTLVRAAWGGWVLGLLFLATHGNRYRTRTVTVLAITGITIWLLLSIGPVEERINARVQTFSNIGQDSSLKVREKSYRELLPQALLNPVGEGLGSIGVATKLKTSGGELGRVENFDTGLLSIPWTLGWPGTLLYVGGLTWLLFYALRTRSQSDFFATASQGIVIAALAQLVFGLALTGVVGMVLWSFLGLSLVAGRYHNRVRSSEQKGSLKRLDPVYHR